MIPICQVDGCHADAAFVVAVVEVDTLNCWDARMGALP